MAMIDRALVYPFMLRPALISVWAIVRWCVPRTVRGTPVLSGLGMKSQSIRDG